MLILLPNLISEETSHELFLPAIVKEKVAVINGIIAESEKEARRYLKRFIPHFREIPIRLLNEHTSDINELIKPLLKGETWGLISDAGLPCIADPGHLLVAKARELNIQVQALPGPSSLMLALMLSGLPAQRFSFHGYLPREEVELKAQLRKLEKEGITQLFIEAPYRSEKMLNTLIETLNDKTRLCVASNLTATDEFVATHSIFQWKKLSKPQINKKPTVFLFH